MFLITESTIDNKSSRHGYVGKLSKKTEVDILRRNLELAEQEVTYLKGLLRQIYGVVTQQTSYTEEQAVWRDKHPAVNYELAK